MAESRSFSYQGLFAKNSPEPREGAVGKRGKYDFAVAYPDPKSVPLEGLMDALKGALEEEGEDLVYPLQECSAANSCAHTVL